MEGWNGNDPLQAEHCALIITPLVSKRVPAKLTDVIKDVNAGVLQAPSPETNYMNSVYAPPQVVTLRTY